MNQPAVSNYRVTHYQQIVPQLDRYVSLLRERNDPAGYFAALYRVTATAIGAAIDRGAFEDNHRLAAINVHFFHRYQDALEAYLNGGEMTETWKACFAQPVASRLITKQHLLLGMNAHISLDLPICIATVCPGKTIFDFRKDFLHVNRILKELYQNVLRDMSGIWPPHKLLHYFTVGYNASILDHRMRMLRERAWLHAVKLALIPDHRFGNSIQALDRQVARRARWLKHPGFALKTIVDLIRLTEKGTVAEKIDQLLY